MGCWILHFTGTSKTDPSFLMTQGGGEGSIMEPLPYGSICGAWHRLTTEWKLEWDLNGTTQSYSSSWKLGGLESLLYYLGNFFPFHVSTVGNLLCFLGVGLTCCADHVTVLYGIYAFLGT